MIHRFEYQFLSALSVAFATGIFFFSAPIFSDTSPYDSEAKQLQRGKKIFDISCASCHGITGKGDGVLNSNLNNFPRDLTKGVYKNRSTASGQLPTDYDLYHIVTTGIHNSAMPPFRGLSTENRWAVIQYIKTFSIRFTDSTEYPLDTITIGNPVISSPKSLAHGRKIYLQMKCADCHGISGKGDGQAAFSQADDAGHPVKTTDLTNQSDYKFSRSIQDIYRIFSTGLNGVPMPTYKDVLSDKDRWDLANYVWALQTADQYPPSTVIK